MPPQHPAPSQPSSTPPTHPEIECGPGWKPLIRPILGFAHANGFRIFQVKEKFRFLCVYFDGASRPPSLVNELHELVHAAELLSGVTCEYCGEYATEHWHRH